MTNTEKLTIKLNCEKCGEEIAETYALQYDDGYYCLDCWLKVSYDNHLLIDYMYKPKPRFCKMSFEKNPLFMGIELEVEGDEDNAFYGDKDEDYDNDDGGDGENNEYINDYAYDIMKTYPCYIKYDGSLNGNGMEIVTHPLTVKYHKRVFNWRELLKKLEKDNFTSHSNNRCGLHIHISKKWFKPEDYLKFNIIFDKNYSVIKRFAKRTKTNYCERVKTSETREIAEKKKATRLSQWYNHYKSIYFGNSNTIELRIYRGTLNIERFNMTLDMTEALAYFVKSYSLVFFIKTTKKDLWFTFLKFLQQAKRYSKLLKHLDKNNLTFCNLNKIPRSNTQCPIEIKDPMELMGNKEIKEYLKNRILKKLVYYFDDFEDYTINHRNDVYYLNDGYFIPINFEKIILYNNSYNAKKRQMIITFFIHYGFIITLKRQNITIKIKNQKALAEILGIDIKKIEARKEKRKERQEKKLKKEYKNGTISNYSHLQPLFITDERPPDQISAYDIQEIKNKCDDWEKVVIDKSLIKELAKKKNKDISFIINSRNI